MHIVRWRSGGLDCMQTRIECIYTVNICKIGYETFGKKVDCQKLGASAIRPRRMGRLSIVVPPSEHLAQHRKLKAHEAELERRQRELESTIEHAQAELADVRREKAEIICERQGLRWSASFASEGAMEEVYDVPMTPEEVEARLMPSPVRRALEAMQREICMRGMGQGAGRGFGSTGKNVIARARRAGRGRTADGAKCMHKIRRLKRKQDRPRASSSSLERREGRMSLLSVNDPCRGARYARSSGCLEQLEGVVGLGL